jgi:hypothetical protein
MDTAVDQLPGLTVKTIMVSLDQHIEIASQQEDGVE